MPLVTPENPNPQTPQEIDNALKANRLAAQKLHMQKRQMQAAAARANARAAMTPAEVAADQSYDALYNKVFNNPDGLEVLKNLEQTRPVVADMIKERLTRADPNFGISASMAGLDPAAHGAANVADPANPIT